MQRAIQPHEKSGSGSARYRPPRAPRLLVHRSRIVERFHASLGRGLTVVQAPAGYGKTAAITSCLGDLDYDARWLSLDASSASPEVFATQMVAAVLGDDAWPAPSGARPEDLRAYLNAALNRREQTATQALLLVVDNAHLICDAYQCCDLLDWLIETLPFAAEVILAGREPLPLREVDRRVAGGECLSLGTADLAFTEGEVAQLCAQSGASLSVGEIMEATAGWPVAVTGLLAGAVSTGGTLEAIAGGSWDRYLFSEVWEAIPPPLATVLLKVCTPAVLDDWLAETLATREEWRELRQWLTERNFLFEALADGGVRLNPQFRLFLRERLLDRDPVVAQEIVRLTVAALESRGQVADAIEASMDLPAILAEVLIRNHTALFQQAAFHLLWRGYSALPAEIIDNSEILAATRIRVMAHAGFPDRALTLSGDFLAERRASATARYHVLLGRARALRLLGRVGELADLFAHAKVAVEEADSALVAEFLWQEAEAILAIEADFIKVERILLRVLDLTRESDHRVLELLAISTYGHLLVMRGDGPRAVNELMTAARGWRAMQGTANLGWVLNNLGMAHLMVGDFAAAAATLHEARQEAVRCQNRRTEAFAIASMGDAEVAAGRFEDARGHYEEAIAICAEEVLDESLATLSVAGLAAAMLGQGEIEQADFLARRALDAAGIVANPFELGHCALLLAAVELAAGEADKAVTSARRAVECFKSLDAKSSLRTAFYRLAMCEFRAGDRQAATAALVDLSEEMPEAWMAGALVPLVRENPVFAQWAIGRRGAPAGLRTALERLGDEEPAEAPQGAPALPGVRAESLGRLRVTVETQEVTDDQWASSRARELFFLFLSRPRGLRKEEAVECLYPDLPASRCNSAFHSNLYRVRKALYHDSIVKRDGVYTLNPGGVFEWDAAQFEAGLARAEALAEGSADRAGAYEEALHLYQGPFAEAFESEWAAALRDRLEQRFIETLSRLAGYHAGRGHHETAATLLRRVLESDPYNEQAAYALARAQVHSGHGVAALQFLDDYAQRLNDDLGVTPEPRLTDLREAIAAGRAG